MQDQNKATSHLLESQSHPYAFENSQEAYLKQQQLFRGYDDDDVRALNGSGSAAEGEWSKPPTPVLWRGLPFYLLTWDFLSIGLCICFLALGACVASLEGKTATNWSFRVIQATKIAPSVWPIVFSGVLGNAVRSFADWTVERGVSLLALEQLLGSLTMASSVITIFRWSIFRVSSLALILLWAFNPLGSQASFRGVYLRSNTGISQGDITYYNANLSVQLYLTPFGSASSRSKPAIRALYSSTLYDYVSSIQYVDPTNGTAKGVVTMLGGDSSAGIQAATDTWGNVRIPNLEYLSDYDSSKPQQWLETPWDQKVLNYSSLLGDRIVGVDRNFVGNSTFTISSSYQHYNCAPWFQLNTSSPTFQLNSSTPVISTNTSEADLWLTKNTGKNYLEHIRPPLTTRLMFRTFFVAFVLRNMTTTRDVPELVFAARGNDHMRLSVTKCTARTMYVDAKIACISKGSLGKAICGATAVREMPKPPADVTVTVLDQSPHAGNSFLSFMDMLEDIQTGSGQSSNTEYYLYDPLTAFTNPDNRNAYAELGTVDIATFERRFSLLWNTLWKIAWANKSVMGGNFSAPVHQQWGSIETLQNTTSHVTFPLPAVYAIDRAWLTLYFVSVGVMFFAAIFSLVLHSQCRAPPILGFASSLIRDSPYFDDCGINRSSAEDGPQKSRRLGKLKVMVADVRSENGEAGKIAFAPVGLGKKVEKGRWYD